MLGITENDVCFSAGKLYHAYGLGNGMSFPMSVGATTALLPDRPTPAAIFEVLRREQPTLFFGAPTLYAMMLADPACTPENGSKRLRWCVSAAEALPEHVGTEWKKRFGVDILDGLGSTEMLHIFVSNQPGKLRYGTSGIAVPGYDLRIVDDKGADVADGELGELLVRGPTRGGGLLEPARENAPHLRGRVDAHRRQLRARSGRHVSLLRPQRRHVQGVGPVGVAVRRGVRADLASVRAGGRGGRQGGRRRAAAAEGLS